MVMKDNVLHGIECDCQQCLDKWEKIKPITLTEYNNWVKMEGIPLTKNVCKACGRRTDNCPLCGKKKMSNSSNIKLNIGRDI